MVASFSLLAHRGPLVHGVIPWAISTLTSRHGWAAGLSPGIWNCIGLIPITVATALLTLDLLSGNGGPPNESYRRPHVLSCGAPTDSPVIRYILLTWEFGSDGPSFLAVSVSSSYGCSGVWSQSSPLCHERNAIWKRNSVIPIFSTRTGSHVGSEEPRLRRQRLPMAWADSGQVVGDPYPTRFALKLGH